MTTDQFEEIFEKIKDFPESGKYLRKVVYNKAVRGQILPQMKEDKKALILLEEIDKERSHLIQLGKIKNYHLPSSIENPPLDLPNKWLWVPLGLIGNIFSGNSMDAPTKESFRKNANGLPYIATKDIGYSGTEPNYENGINVPQSEKKFKIARSGSVLICAEGGSAGKKISITRRDVCFGNKLFSNQPFTGIEPKFISYVYLSDFFYSLFIEQMAGVIGGVSLKKFIQLPFPLPPKNEQRRIVAKVEELMSLCDELDEFNQKTNQTKIYYLKSLTKKTADKTKNFNKDSILSSAFTNTPKNSEGIQELKKLCINLAIQMDGRSIDENNKVIEKLKELTNRMKADKTLPKSFSIKMPDSELFSTFSNLSLGSLAFIKKGSTGIKTAQPGEYPLVVTAAERQTCNSYDFDTKAAIVPLVSSTGHGHASIQRLHFQSGKFALGTILAAIIPFKEELFSSRFIYEYLTAFKEELLVSRMVGTANVSLTLPKISEVSIPIISLKTQKWVCEVCEICDEIKLKLENISSIKKDLLKSLLL